jgi:hypothetical protein
MITEFLLPKLVIYTTCVATNISHITLCYILHTDDKTLFRSFLCAHNQNYILMEYLVAVPLGRGRAATDPVTADSPARLSAQAT